jgi:hypothetical protein
MKFPVPANETARLAGVRALNILDTAPEPAYDEISELAAQVCRCPAAFVSFMDDDRLWLKAKYGLPVMRRRFWAAAARLCTDRTAAAPVAPSHEAVGAAPDAGRA